MTKLNFPLPGGPVRVMKVLGYSANHLLTLFSASTLSDHADLPIASVGMSFGLVDGDEDRKNENEDKENFERMSEGSYQLLD